MDKQLTLIEKDALRAIEAGALLEVKVKKEIDSLVRMGLVQLVAIPTARGLKVLEGEKQPA